MVLWVLVTISFLTPSSAPAVITSADPDAQLKRGALFGAKVASVSDEVRDQLKLDQGVGALIEAVIPGSSAEAAGFKPGDVLLSLDGARIMGGGDAIQQFASRKAGAIVTIESRRGVALRKESITLKGRPLEKSDV
jgi:S1-C subfamily serine protease